VTGFTRLSSVILSDYCSSTLTDFRSIRDAFSGARLYRFSSDWNVVMNE
jgi:hypothetical protein